MGSLLAGFQHYDDVCNTLSAIIGISLYFVPTLVHLSIPQTNSKTIKEACHPLNILFAFHISYIIDSSQSNYYIKTVWVHGVDLAPPRSYGLAGCHQLQFCCCWLTDNGHEADHQAWINPWPPDHNIPSTTTLVNECSGFSILVNVHLGRSHNGATIRMLFLSFESLLLIAYL